MAKRAAAGTLALAVCLTGGAALASSAQAATGFSFSARVGGADRFETAALASAKAFKTADTVVVVNYMATVDGLSASYAAGLHNAPVLYTKANELPDVSAAEIDRLGAKNIIIVGGTGVVSADLKSSWESDGFSVTRYAGDNRYETAAEVAASGDAKPGKVFVANGNAPADALAVGPIAFAKHYPILLTKSDEVPTATSDELAALGTSTRVVAGGNAVVSDSTYADLKASKRLYGANRQGTAVEVSKWAIATEGFSNKDAALVGNTDANTADALVAAPLAGKNGVTLLFTQNGTVGTTTGDYLKSISATLTGTGYVFGGTGAVSKSIADEATRAAVGSVVNNQSYTVKADGASTVELDNTGKGSVKYVVSGLGSDNVDIALFKPSSLNITSDGASFVDADGDLLADRVAPTGASISVVNGVSQTASAGIIYNVKPANGTITFTVAANAADQAVPVVYANAKSATSYGLKVDAKAVATEKFGIGEQAGFVPAEATFGAHGGVAVAAGGVNAKDGYFVSSTATYYVDSNDTYKYQGVGITKEQFASILQGGGTVDVAYSTSESASSTFNIQTATVPSVSAVKAVAGGTGGSDVSVSWTAPSSSTGLNYSLWRSTDNTLDTTADTRVAKDLTGVSYTDAGVADGTYYYFVVTNNTANGATDSGVMSASVTAPLAADTIKPASLETVVEDKGFSNVLDAGDILSFGASEVVKLGSNPGIVVSTSTDSVTLDSSNATFAADGQSIKVTVTKTPTYGTAASTLALTSGSTVSNSRGITDAAGNVLDTTTALTIAAAPTGTANDPTVASTATQAKFTVSFGTAVDATQLTASDFTVPSGNSVTSISVSASGNVATVNLSAALASGDVVGMKAKTVQDAAHTLTSPSVAVTHTTA